MEDHFLHQFQSIVFSNKLAEGTATEKADILRRALMELKNANTNKLYDCCNFIYSLPNLSSVKAGHSTSAGHRACSSNCIFFGYFVFKNENVKVKVKYYFVLYTGFAGPPFLL